MKKWLAIFLSCLFIFPMALMPNMASAADGDFGGYVVKELNYNSVNGLYTIGSSGLLINPALVFTTPIDLEKLGYVDGDGKIKSNLALQMDLFMDGNLTALKAGVGQIEFTSSGTCDKEEINTSVAGMQWKEGEWVRQAIPLSTFGNGSADSSAFDPSAINYMRIYIVGMEKFAGEIMRLKICNVRLVDTSKTAPTPEQDRIGDGSFIPDAPVWELAPIGGDYTTTDDVVMGYNLKDYLNDEYFEGKDPAKDDVTPIIQSLLDGLEQAGGGTLFIPAGEYHMEGSLNIPKGVTLCGEWSQPDGKSPVKGTIFKIYNGKGDAGGRPFISLTNNCMVRNVTFWYPEQKLENGNPIAYPPTILGGSYSHVRNVTFVNSFVAVQQGPTMSGCPNVYNAYGTPLMTGFDIDGIADIGRYDTINFAPDYWINSGLAGAPSTEEEIEKLKESLGSQAVGIILRRIDWSYLAFYNVTGYGTGLSFSLSECTEEFNEETGRRYSYPNGNCYGLNFKDCAVAIYVQGVSGSGEVLSNVNIDNCTVGISVADDSHAAGGNIQFADTIINATDLAIDHEGQIKMSVLSSTIQNGLVQTSNGAISMIDCDFETEAPHVTLESGTHNAIFTGNRFKGDPVIENLGLCPSSIDHTPVEVDEIKQLTEEQTRTREAKAAKNTLYVVNVDNTGATDVTAAIQAKLDEAGKAGGGIVYLPAGQYRLDGSLTVPTGVELKGVVDLGRIPYNTGTIFEVYGGKGDPDAAATVILKEKSGIRGITFDYPEQFPKAEKVVSYPYAVQGAGSDIYIVNVSSRNGYNGIDLMSNRCDNHYVEYFAGVCINNAIRVGGGSKNGLINNYQTNYNAMLGGGDAGWGVWENSPTPDEKPSFEIAMKEQTQHNAIILQLGDVTDQVVFNSFSYSGGRGVQFMAENGKAPNGIMVGHGVDFATVAFEFKALGDMQIINTQLTSFNAIGDALSSDATMHDVMLTADCDDRVDFYNLTMWAQPTTTLRVDNGTLNVYNCNFSTNNTPLASVEKAGTLNVVGGNINRNDKAVVATANLDRITLNSMFYLGEVADAEKLGGFKNMVKRITRWNVPNNAQLDQNSTMVFTESFEGYGTETVNDIPNVPAKTGPFNVVSAQNQNGNVTLVDEDMVSALRFFMNENGASYLVNRSIELETGKKNSLYRIEARVKLHSLINKDWSLFEIGMLIGGEQLQLAGFSFADGFQINYQKVANYDLDTWYRVCVEFDLRDETHKTYQAYLLDDDYAVLAVSPVVNVPEEYQKAGVKVTQIVLEYLSDGQQGDVVNKSTAEVFLDYVYISQSEESTFSGAAKGDINGDSKVDTTDARLALQYAVGKITLAGTQLTAGDVNGDGKVDTTDARLILQKAVGKISAFPTAK